ncbi:hypothetical protein G9A89_016417 [Geosiphon pyriformis]|nr:hypothetical protein G9A89_016417 [Geosiphon pyriformis]
MWTTIPSDVKRIIIEIIRNNLASDIKDTVKRLSLRRFSKYSRHRAGRATSFIPLFPSTMSTKTGKRSLCAAHSHLEELHACFHSWSSFEDMGVKRSQIDIWGHVGCDIDYYSNEKICRIYNIDLKKKKHRANFKWMRIIPTTVATAEQILVPETLLKKRKNQEKITSEKVAALNEKRKAARKTRRVIFKRAEKYVKEYRALEREEIRLRRQAKAGGNYFVPSQPKLAFVIRIKGINKIAPKPRKVLQLLRLLQINNGVFIRLTKATKQMLQLVTPYVAYGEPNLKSVRELIYKRGHAKINKQRIPITDNSIIENALGKFGIICIEDLVHEIFTVGPQFKQANNFLWPFKLSNPNGGWNRRKFRHFVEGGDYGDREDRINDLIHRMN